MSKKPWASIRRDVLKSLADEYARRVGISTLGGKVPTGKVLHKGVPTYQGNDARCDRFLVVSDNVWLLIDEEDDVIRAVDADYAGRIHWEHQCPN